jgi:hypothetical protein
VESLPDNEMAGSTVLSKSAQAVERLQGADAYCSHFFYITIALEAILIY